MHGKKNYMLTYKQFKQLEVIGYDSGFAECLDSRKSTSSCIDS